jgi:hypothetical protein
VLFCLPRGTEATNAEKRKLWTRIQEFQKKVEQHESFAQHLRDKEAALAVKGVTAIPFPLVIVSCSRLNFPGMAQRGKLRRPWKRSERGC